MKQRMSEHENASALRAAAMMFAAAAALAFCSTGCMPLPNECEPGESQSCRETYGATSYCADDGICDTYTTSQYLAEPCNLETVGPVFEEGTYNVGVILALNRNADYYGLIEPMAKAMKLAVNDVNRGNGINGTRMGLIFCNTDGENSKAQEAANHLAKIGVQAVLGPDFSGYTLEVVPGTLIPNGMLAISPSATAPAISGLDDDSLMWRTVASDKIQATVLADLIQYVKDDVVVAQGDKPRIAMMVRESDPYADGLSQGTIEGLPTSTVDDEDAFKTFIYPNAAIGMNDYTQAALDVAEYKPDIVLLWGLTEVWDIIEVLDGLLEEDAQLTDTIYITADGGKDTVKADDVGSMRPSLTGRVWGTAPRSLSADEYAPYKAFKVRWSSEHATDADTHPFITNAYDAVYLLAFSIAASNSSYPTGAQLAEGMKKLTDPKGTPIVANQQDFPAGVTALSNGKTIDFSGASGPLEFDDNGDPVSTTVSLWCLNGDKITEQGDLLEAGSSDFQQQRCNYMPSGGMQ